MENQWLKIQGWAQTGHLCYSSGLQGYKVPYDFIHFHTQKLRVRIPKEIIVHGETSGSEIHTHKSMVMVIPTST